MLRLMIYDCKMVSFVENIDSRKFGFKELNVLWGLTFLLDLWSCSMLNKKRVRIVIFDCFIDASLSLVHFL